MIKIRLKVLLAEKDLNYTRLSEVTGISINALSRLGRGETTEISFSVLEKICVALDCQVGDLLVRLIDTDKTTPKKWHVTHH